MSFISWEAFSSFLEAATSFIISLVVAFVGGYLAHYGKEMAKVRIERRRKRNEKGSIDKG